MRLLARKMLKYTPDELLKRLTGSFTLVFDDGEIETDWKETIFSRHIWKFHVEYPDTPLLVRHHYQSVSNGKKVVNTKTHSRLISKVLWEVYENEVKKIPGIELLKTPQMDSKPAEMELKLRDDLAALAYRIVNDLYNFSVKHLLEYVSSLDILDFTEIVLHPAILDIKAKMQPTHRSAGVAFKEVGSFIMKDSSLDHNRLARATRAGLVKRDQVIQCIGPRGTVTETDSTPFIVPVLSGFAEGIRPLHESLFESRSAAKSLAMAGQEISDAEYFSRKLQLLDMQVVNLHMADCGSKSYNLWTVREGELPTLAGAHYIDNIGRRQIVREDSFYLVGETIKLRNPIHCNHPDPYGICSECFGDLAYSVLKGSNIGHMSATNMCQKVTQGIMSIKHSDSGGLAEPIRLKDPFAKKFFKVSSDGNSYIFNRDAKAKVKYLILPPQACGYIKDIYLVKDVRDLPAAMVTELADVGLVVPTKNGEEEIISIPVKQEGRLASLSYDFLDHIKRAGIELDDKDRHRVPLEGWNWNLNVMNMPLRHYNMADLSKEISDMIEAKMKDMAKRDKHVSPTAFLDEFYRMVNSRIQVNIAVLGVVMLGIMLRSAENYDYRLPKQNTERGLGVLKPTMAGRSLSAAMAYQEHSDVIFSPFSFTRKVRPHHPFDALLMPEIVGRGHNF
jgi:hypothetical protein